MSSRLWYYCAALAVLMIFGINTASGKESADLSKPESPEQGKEQMIEIGNRRELFVDNYVIEKMTGGAKLLLHKPVMREVVLDHNEPWEGNACGYHTIFQDGDLYRMYYRGWHFIQQGEKVTDGKAGHAPVVCYAESKDGIRWTKPDLGLVEFRGSKKNNIVWAGLGALSFVPFKDGNPKCKPDEQYKAVGGGRVKERKLYGFVSADGLRWRQVADEPIMTDGAFDSQNLVFWDAVRGEYRTYYRDFRKHAKGHVRDIKTATSDDFRTWPKGTWLKYPGAPTEELYVNQIQPYDRAPHLFVGFPARFRGDREDLVEGLLMTSRDGRTFRRWGEAIIRPGRNRDRWHNRSNYIWLGLVETKSDLPGGGGELSLYTNERYYKDRSVKTRRYTYRIDGFVSVNAPLRGGTVLTRPFTFTGARLHLNLSTSAAGAVRVEIQNADGKPLKGFGMEDCPPIYGDEIDHIVEWKQGADVTPLSGRPIRLRFSLSDADVFAFRFE
jgi:hypothetical protein